MDQRRGQDPPAVAGTVARLTLAGVPAGAPFFLPFVRFQGGSDRRKNSLLWPMSYLAISLYPLKRLVSRNDKICNFVCQASRFWPPIVAGPVPRERVAREIYWREPLAGRGIPEGCGAGRGFATSPHLDGRKPRHRGACRPGHGNRGQECSRR
jgi:hypothetical protein